MTKIKEWFQNRKARPAAWPKNMAVLYLLCIILPLVATDTIFFAMIINSGRSDTRYSYEKAAENMAFRFGNILENASNITMNIIKNDEFEKFLEKDYESGLDYFEGYVNVTNDKFLKALCSINNASFEIYTDNPTIINGGGIYNLNRVVDSGWYKDFVASGQDTYVKFYYDMETGTLSKPRRKLMFISRMGYFPRGKYRKICNIVIEYGAFSRNMESVSTGATGYIADDEYAYVFTGGNNNIYDDFRKISDVKGRIGYSRDYSYSGTPFTINVFENNGSGFETIRKNWPLFLIMVVVNAILPIFFAKLTQTVQLGKLKEQEMDIARQQAELLALHSQINPHFLFNTLNAGEQLARMEGADKTTEFIENMADFFRYNIKKIDNDASIAEEIALVDKYVYILNVRFTGEIHYSKDIDEEVTEVRVPSMILQPIVENAVNYGIRDIDWEGHIDLKVYKQNSDVMLSIKDNGVGMSKDKIDRILSGEAVGEVDADHAASNGIGLGNVIERLQIFTGKQDVMEIFSEGENKGTEFVIKVPMHV